MLILSLLSAVFIIFLFCFRSSTKVSLAPTSKDDLVLDVKMSRMTLGTLLLYHSF
jgi:hypothetical protein